jgi:hypothetical protein
MRKLYALLILLGVLACPAARAGDPVYQSQTIACAKSALYDASTNGSTKLVTGNSTQQIYVCGFTILAAGSVNVGLNYGTGSTCGTGTHEVTPAFQLVAQAGCRSARPTGTLRRSRHPARRPRIFWREHQASPSSIM